MNETTRKKHIAFVELMKNLSIHRSINGSMDISMFDAKTKLKLICAMERAQELMGSYEKERQELLKLSEKVDKVTGTMDKIEAELSDISETLTPLFHEILKSND